MNRKKTKKCSNVVTKRKMKKTFQKIYLNYYVQLNVLWRLCGNSTIMITMFI